MEIATEPRLLVTGEVAKMLRCSEARIRELVAEGRLTPLRLTPRGHYRFRANDIERLIRGEESP
jgi:excisionase family DNA binding protein